MKTIALLVVLLFGCTPTPVVPVVDADAMPVPPSNEDAGYPDVMDAAPIFQDTACGHACAALYAVGCPNNAPSGTACSDWLCSEPAYALSSSSLKCMAAAKTKTAARNCGVVCP